MKHCIRKILMIYMCMVMLSVFSACHKQPVKISAADTAMGTVVQVTIYETGKEAGEAVVEEIRAELTALEEECLSWRKEGSQVAEINASAGELQGISLSGELEKYLEEIWMISQKSEGALDITIGPVTKVWKLDEWAALSKEEQANFTVPAWEVLEKALQDTGYEKIGLQEGKIILPKGMSLDMGAVGKGIACDKIGKLLKDSKAVKGAVISVGGSVVTYGNKPDGGAWNVAITHPREAGTYIGTLSLQGEWYVSTSGDYERYVEKDGNRYHHIMNPDTGYPARSGLRSVTILSNNGLLSDALSTACFVLGREEGLKLAHEMGAEALFVTTDSEIIMTDGMKKYFEEK